MTCLNYLTGFLNFDLFIGTTVIKVLYFAGAFLVPLFLWLVLQRGRARCPRIEGLLSLLAEKTGERAALWLIFSIPCCPGDHLEGRLRIPDRLSSDQADTSGPVGLNSFPGLQPHPSSPGLTLSARDHAVVPMEEIKEQFHSMSPEEVLEALSSGPEGLSEEEARKRLDEFGPNRIPEPKKQNVLLRFFKHFHDVLIYVLLISAIATALLGHWIDTWIILAVVILNSFVGFVQEGRAEKAIEAVRRMLSVSSSVSRDGKKRQIPAEELVPGDIVLLSSGDKIPADLRLIRIHELQVNEASLTGESDTVSKTTETVKAEAALGDRTCMAYSGTIVVSGTARAIVISTGENTEIGKINRMLAEVEPLATPLLRKVNSFGIKLSIFILAMAGAVFLYGSLVMGMPFNEIFLFVVAIAVAAIPEGLPAVISIILAIGVRRMAGRNAIIRRLPGWRPWDR